MFLYKKKLALILILLLGIWSGCSGNDTKDKPPVNVVVQKVTRAVDEQSIAYNGTIEESESIPLSFSTVGNVSRVLVSEGDFVKKGQLLASLNDETYKNAYEMSLASQKQAEDAYKRLLPMYKNGNLPEIKLVEVETGLQQAKASALITKKNVDDCRLYSPVDGIVGKRSIEPGMSAIPNLTSITIVKIEKVFAKVPVSESEISSVKIGDKAKIKIVALKDPDFIGTVEEIGVMADPIAHTYKIKIAILNRNRQIKPGMICNVTINKINETAGLFVTNSAVLVDEKGKNFVYAVNGDKAFRKYVTTGKLLRNGVEITGGLNNGEQIVITGQHKLDDNTPVRIVNR
jgi:membrane fusion protein, multidrug efflux system